MNRLGLFLFFDSEGIVDDYVKYLLDDMNKNLSHLCIIVNGELLPESRKIFENYTDDILIRSNQGFDVGAWKDAMIQNFGFNKLEEYDEVILFNDSFFGPIYPFKEMFNDMDKKDLDFWGITVHGDAPDPKNLCPYPYRPRYLQLFFLVFRRNFVKSKEFQDYWQNLPYYENFNDVAYKHQAVFTKYFSDLGFKWAAYVDTGDLEESVEKSISFHTYNMYDMVSDRKLPVIKRKAFKLPLKFHLIFNSGMDIAKTMDYLKENTDYDVSLIYKYFLRTMGPCELATILNLKQIIPKTNINTSYKSNKKIAVILQINHINSVQYTFNYIKNIPEYIDIVIMTDGTDKKDYIGENCLKLNNNIQIMVVPNQDISSLFVDCKDICNNYDYFCFVNDKKADIDDYLTVRNSFMNSLWENILASPDYINSIIKEFDENNNLGLMVPTTFYHGTYFNDYSDKYWNSSYGDVENLFNRMNLHTKLSRDEYVLSIGNCFWAKTNALKPLFDLDLNHEDFYSQIESDTAIDHILEKIYPYVAASQRYYTKTVMTDEYGKNELTNYQYMLNETVNVINKKSKGLVNLNKTFSIYISTLPKSLINKTKFKQLKKVKLIEESTSWKITKPLRKLFSIFKKLIKKIMNRCK